MAGKVVLITGASRGIGAAVARRLASEGATLALVGLEPDELKKVAEDCGPDAGWWEADVTDTESLRTAVEAVVERYGRIDVVVANAGIAAPGFSRSMDPAVWERVLDVDLYGVWRTVHLTLPHLLESKGYLLLVSSLAAIVHIPGLASYNVAKAGVEAMGNSLRAELKHLGVGRRGRAHDVRRHRHGARGRRAPGVRQGPHRRTAGQPGLPTGIRGRQVRPGHQEALSRRARARLDRPAEDRSAALIPHLVELGARFSVPKADRAALADIEARGAAASSRASGAGGLADTEKAAQR